ncbi:transglycosylase/D,D-transpeptidase PonA1 [Actinoallomurus bryophytorum]|uniref:Membrane peptidoglycan carboxypeptidase n=1 Tax=Actinoallomurus bryophytorum TaxID=1490222 RepID=A0A543CS51_9ACTN|nr:transglycosylase domain-containing protein [Actinoallomurus bryophytorum]TQL99941.1 membrane peptidoglycan carboxypeptidase [Actinoallomurus bryophytorum]
MNRRRWRLVRRTLYGLGIVVAGLCAAVGIMYARTKVPPVNAAAQAQSSTFSFRDGTTLAQVGRLNRVPVRLGDVPPYVRGAVLAAEDRGFYEDPVVSPTGLARASWAAVSGGTRQGGSGIAQQYVKVAYLSPEQTVSRKVKELFIAVKLSRSRSKDWIFEQYLNTVYFGRGAYGIQAASQAYFHKDVGALTPAEAALLAGVIQAPSYLDPALGHTAQTRARWRYVIDGMTRTGVLPKGPPPAFPRVAPAHTEPTYAGQRGYLIQQIIGELHAHGIDDDQIYRRGLLVTSTIDARLQAAAPEAVRTATGHDKDLEAGLTSVRPGTGEILASYGGRDYLEHQYDNAFLAALPPGSSFDPFVLATALHEGIGLRSTYDASRFRAVVNDDDAKAASADLVTATTESYNTVFSRLGTQVGASGAAKAGLPGRFPPPNVRVVDEAAAYAALASGTYAAPHIVAKVTDRSGKVLLNVRPRTRPAFSHAVSADVAFALQGVAKTEVGRRAALPDRPIAGKFGTTDHNAAAWFCGYTPRLATSVAVYRASNRPLINIGNAPHQKSATVPAVIWGTFMTRAEAGQPVEVFPPPVFAGAVRRFTPPSPLPSTKAVPPPVRPTLPSKKIPAARPSTIRKAGRPTPTTPLGKPTHSADGDQVGDTG